jgi:hypothetical protein
VETCDFSVEEWSNDPLDDEKAEIDVPDVQRY